MHLFCCCVVALCHWACARNHSVTLLTNRATGRVLDSEWDAQSSLVRTTVACTSSGTYTAKATRSIWPTPGPVAFSTKTGMAQSTHFHTTVARTRSGACTANTYKTLRLAATSNRIITVTFSLCSIMEACTSSGQRIMKSNSNLPTCHQ